MGVGLFMTIGVTSASAETCPPGVFCAWNGVNMTGQMWTFPFSTYHRNGACNVLNVFTGLGMWSSIKNDYGTPDNRPWKVRIYSDQACGATLLDILGGSTMYDLYTWSNRNGSFRVLPYP